MIQKQTIIWTALPYGYADDGQARLSVLVSPRLECSDPHPILNQFKDFVTWPNTLDGVEFYAHFYGVAQPVLLKKQFVLVPDLWGRIFPPDTYIRSHQFTDLKDHLLRTFPLRATLGYLKNTYTKWASTHPGIPPHYDITDLQQSNLDDLIGNLGGINQYPMEYGSKLEQQLAQNRVLPPGSLGTTSDYYQAHAFYNRAAAQAPFYKVPDAQYVPLPPDVPEFDFHDGVAMLADHPSLMRWLGLVLDFTLDLPPSQVGAIRVEPRWNPSNYNEDLTPFTHFLRGNEYFLARWADNSDLQAGCVNLEAADDIFEEYEAPYSLVQVDPDGSVLKLLHFSDGLNRLSYGKAPFGMDPEAPLPALRSGGLGLTREGRAFRLHNHLTMISQRNQSLLTNNPNKTPNPLPQDFFWAEDLLRGYRVDVEDQTAGGKRLSLCWREGHYLFKAGDPVDLKPEEGYIKSASSTSQENAPNELYLHEMLFRWNGWSLCAERPNQALVPTTSQQIDPITNNKVDVQAESLGRTPNKPEGPIDLEPVLEAVPGTLPRLRFGHTYRLRVRSVDIAGNSLPADHPDWEKASKPVLFQRFEPVPSPAIVLHDRLTPAEGIERMVIRSNYDQPAGEECQRHVVPPKTSQEMAEIHGRFDAYIGVGANHQKGFNIALKEAGTLADKQVIDLADGQSKPLPDASKIEVIEVLGDSPSGKVTQLVIHNEDTLVLPYLPDPMAVGVTFRDIPRLTAAWLPDLAKVLEPNLGLQVLKVPFDQMVENNNLVELNWPDAAPFRLRLAERHGQMTGTNCNEDFIADETSEAGWDAKKRVLSIYLAKAEMVTLRYSCYLPNGGEALFAIWRWLQSQPNQKLLLKYIQAGCLWMITPYRKLVLVHAVQQPLCAPSLNQNVEAIKDNVGQTKATFTGSATLNAWSTEKVDLLANWQDWDDTSGDTPMRVSKNAHACDGTIAYEESNQVALDKAPHAFYHEFDDTHHRWVDYHLVGTSRFREYFQPKQGSPTLDFTRSGPIHQLRIPNSARPAAPKVVYIVPSFGWKTLQQGNTITRLRVGGGLRVYLERPWYSSGDDELLGVVLAQQDPAQLQQNYPYFIPLVTQCGMDPIWKTTLPKVALDHTDFTGFNAMASDRTLEELAQLPPGKPNRVNVVGYAPEYNEERHLWSCDIQFNPDRLSSYYPFVRLALARFQPYSIPNPDAYLSPVVMTDFMQLVPSRALQVTTSRDKKTIDLILTGYSPLYTGTLVMNRLAPLVKHTNRVQVTIERHDDNIPGDLGWKPVEAVQEQANPIWLEGNETQAGSFLWTWQGTMHLPSERSAGHLRMVVKEFEVLPADGQYITENGDRRIQPAEGLRVVYADIVEI